MLGRERAKDTTLDYAQGFAERRGITPIRVPERVQERARGPFSGLKLGGQAADRQQDVPARGRFAGLKLGTGRGAAEAPATRGDKLDRAVGGYAEAWRDAERMTAQGLPVLPHQAQELARAGKALDAERPNGAADLAAALRRTPGLEQERAIEAMDAAGKAREQGRGHDLARDLPPMDDPGRGRGRGLER